MENRLKEKRDEQIEKDAKKREEGKQKVYLKFIGLRSIKTMVAVFLCLMIGYFGEIDPLNSIIAAIVCMKGSAKLGYTSGIDRTIGTIIGGLYGYFAIIFSRKIGIDLSGIIYYIIISLTIIPVIYSTIYINTHDSVSIATIVLFIVTVSMSDAGDVEPLLYVINRVMDTLIGIAVSVAVNAAIAGSYECES